MAPSEYTIKNVAVNNSWENEVAGKTLHNYTGLSTLSASGQIRVEIVDSIDANPNKMDIIVYQNQIGGLNGGANEEVIGRMFALDRSISEHKIAVPGLLSFSMSKSDVTAATPWLNSAAGGDELFFNIGSSGCINPTDNGTFFSGLPAGFHDGPDGPSKFEIRNIDASNSDYSGNLRIMFTGPTSYQIVDDNNVVLTTNSLRDDQRDVTIEVLGIKMVIHREGDSLKPKDLLEDGFMGTEIRVNGFQKAEGKGGPVTVSVPKFSELNAQGVILTAEKDINFDLGFSKAEAVARRNLTNDLTTLNNTYPESSVTIDASRADSSANGSYRIELGVRNAGADPYRPHIQDPAWTPAANGDYLDNQVLRVYIDGAADPTYIVDLNPKTNNTGANVVIAGVTYRPGDTLPLMDQDGNVVSNVDFLPPYNFFAEMENYELRNNPAATISNTFLDQYERVNRQINLPNGVVINLANVSNTQEKGTASASAFAQSANFIAGDSFQFSVENSGKKAGLEDIGTYSATFQNGAYHPTTIEVFDSLGGSHFVTTTFEHVNKNGREWNYYLSLDPKDPLIQAFLNSPPPGYTVTDPKLPTEEELRKATAYVFSEGRQGKLYFTEGGTVDRFNSYIPKAKFKPADSNAVELRLDMDLVTQFEATFSTEARERNGNTMGILQGFTIEQDGKVIGSYTNGQKAAIAQLAVATFNNPDGLLRSGSNTFEATSSSGLARIGKAGNDGRGAVVSGTLESSNVDLTEEFTELIVTQRSFSANGRIITTSDEFLQEILSLKR
jgi:flagellar hook-basal body protein